MRAAQVKCYSCGRICGEVKAPSVHDLNLKNFYIPKYAAAYGLSEGTPLRCKRCGGAVYIDEPFTVSPRESLASEEALHLSNVRG